MERRKLLTTVIAFLFCLLPAFGQTFAEKKLTMNVPFDFMVGDKLMPAGEYAFWSQGTSFWLIQNVKTRESVMPMTRNVTLTPTDAVQPETDLVFSYNGKVHELHQIKLRGDDHTHDIVHEKEVADLPH